MTRTVPCSTFETDYVRIQAERPATRRVKPVMPLDRALYVGPRPPRKPRLFLHSVWWHTGMFAALVLVLLFVGHVCAGGAG